ncbi:MAG: SAM-dependent chlorinase/fluorinase [Candidatus Krumholzibacteriia bacterium]
MSGAVVLVTDFGLVDPWVAELRGALLTAWSRWPAAVPRPVVIDGGHEVPRGDAAAGAWFLQRLWRSYPVGTVFLAVVDPGVGTGRAAVACHAHGRLVVGPAGPLLAWLADAPDLDVVTLDRPLYQGAPDGSPASATFHGRDVFAPAAAHLAMGAPLVQVGTPAGSAVLGPPAPPAGGFTIRWVDRFGNAITDLPRAGAAGRRLDAGGKVAVAGVAVAGPVATYGAAAPQVPFWYWGSGGTLEIAVRDGDAARLLGLAPGLAVTVPGP